MRRIVPVKVVAEVPRAVVVRGAWSRGWPESLHHKTHKKCSIITSKFQLKILMDDLRKSPQFVKIHN
jgi:hypothetical protein